MMKTLLSKHYKTTEKGERHLNRDLDK